MSMSSKIQHHVGSIENLPSVRKLRSEVAGLGLLGMLVRNAEAKETAAQINSELDRIVNIVDRFYRVLGDRNWVFFDGMNLDRMDKVVSKPSPDEAERELILYFKEEDTLKWMIRRLNRFPDMQPRINLLEKAERDYLEGRYYSSVLVTVSVMDGFVNDILKDKRRGLHARTASEMYVEDCVAAAWEGLPSVQKVFTKSVHKRIDDPITDVYRHALMHGTATDFDNDVIASKAWCMLFAVGDWAEAKAKTQSEPDQSMTLAEGLCRLAELKRKGAEDHKKLDEWNDHAVDLLNPKDADGEFIRDCTDFFEAWVSKNYGRLSSFFPNYTNQTLGALAGEARRYYSPHPINGYIIEEADRPAPAIAQARIRISSDRGDWVISLRFVRLDGTSPVAEWEPGEWKLVEYTTAPFRDIGALSDE